MAKVEYADVIKTVSGALTKIDKKSPHAADQKMVLATHRVAPTSSPNCSRLYLRGLSAVSRKGTPSSDELAVRAAFSAISRAVNTRLHNQAQSQTDAAAFKAQTTYKTLRQYVWSVCSQEYYNSLNG